MPITPFDGMGVGVNSDTPPWALPPNIWSDARNVRGLDGATEKWTGAADVVSLPGFAQPITNLVQMRGPVASEVFWMIGGQTELWGTNGASSVKVLSTGPFIMSHVSPFQGYLIIARGNFAFPMYWDSRNRLTPDGLGEEVTGNPNGGVLPNWPVLGADVVRPFRNYLFALRCRESSGPTLGAASPFSARLLRWSESAAVNSLPQSWDYTDPTNDSGRLEFGATDDHLVDMVPLRDVAVIYKDHHAWLVQYVGGLDTPFQFRQVFSHVGMLTQDCAVQLKGRHVVLTKDDLVIHDLNDAQSLINGVMRRWLFANIDPDRFGETYLVVDRDERDIYVCFSSLGSATNIPDMALVYNFMDGSVQIRELPYPTTRFDWGLVSGQAINQNVYAPIAAVRVGATSAKLVRLDSGYSIDGNPVESYWHREALPLKPTSQQLISVSRIYPKLIGTAGDTLDIRIGTRASFEDAVTWSDYRTFTIGVDTFVNFREAPGRIIDVYFRHNTANNIRMFGFDIEWFPAGTY